MGQAAARLGYATRMPAVRELLGRVGIFVAHNERHYARQASAQLLELYQRMTREHPELKGRSLYEAVVAHRLGPGDPTAADLVRRAEESFADWPVERELRFRHVVHYQIFHEYMRDRTERPGTRTNIGDVVARVIPEEI
jgi:hypothetical protein